MITKNKRMEEYKIISISPLKLSEKLRKIVVSGFVEDVDGCVYVQALAPKNLYDGRSGNENFFDKTEKECFYNSLRISDYISENIEQISFKVADMLLKKWEMECKDRRIKIVLSFDEFEGQVDAVIKLHTLREEEVPYIDVNSIDDFFQPVAIIRSD